MKLLINNFIKFWAIDMDPSKNLTLSTDSFEEKVPILKESVKTSAAIEQPVASAFTWPNSDW